MAPLQGRGCAAGSRGRCQGGWLSSSTSLGNHISTFFSDPGNRREVCDGRSEQNINSVNYNTKLWTSMLRVTNSDWGYKWCWNPACNLGPAACTGPNVGLNACGDGCDTQRATQEGKLDRLWCQAVCQTQVLVRLVGASAPPDGDRQALLE